MNIKVTTIWLLLLWPCYIPGFLKSCKGNQIDNLNRLIESRKSSNPPRPESWADAKVDALEERRNSPVSIQKGSMQADKITTLPGQPQGVNFDQYAGYVTVDPVADRSLFYYFVESPENSAKKPLLLWLNGGPGCSSFGYGAMQELGPFRVNGDGKTLYRNEYAWNNVANVMFLESPAGVGFSYSKNSSDYTNVGDKKTAEDSYIFLLNWLERFPQYKTRDFFITGESYAGHYAPQLASYILARNNNTNQTVINLKGIAIGNAWIDDDLCSKGLFDYLWTHALNSDETNQGINKHCTFAFKDSSTAIGVPDEEQCGKYQNDAFKEMGSIDLYGIYSPPCPSEDGKSNLTVNIKNYDPCAELRVHSYLNLAEVQAALHVKATNWSGCSNVGWTDSPMTILPDIRNLAREISVWIYSGDVDARVPVTASRYSINNLKLAVETAWLPWYSNREVGGYVVGYKGLVFATVRGAGHTVPSYQPERSLTMITSFLDGKMPPVVSPPS